MAGCLRCRSGRITYNVNVFFALYAQTMEEKLALLSTMQTADSATDADAFVRRYVLGVGQTAEE